MSSTRINKIERLLQKEISELLHKYQLENHPHILITVTVVRVSPDLSLAKVYLSLFPPDKRQVLFDEINDQKRQFRFHLGAKIRNQLRIVPEIAFFIDDSLDYVDKIDRLLKK